MKRICTIYRAAKKDGLYVYMDHRADPADLPEPLRLQTGALAVAMTLVITPDKALARADAGKVLEAIEEQGFYLQLPPKDEDYLQELPNASQGGHRA